MLRPLSCHAGTAGALLKSMPNSRSRGGTAVSKHPDDETFDRLLIVRSEGRLFFMNAQNVFDQNNLALTPCQNSRASDARLLTYRLLVLRPALPLSA